MKNIFARALLLTVAFVSQAHTDDLFNRGMSAVSFGGKYSDANVEESSEDSESAIAGKKDEQAVEIKARHYRTIVNERGVLRERELDASVDVGKSSASGGQPGSTGWDAGVDAGGRVAIGNNKYPVYIGVSASGRITHHGENSALVNNEQLTPLALEAGLSFIQNNDRRVFLLGIVGATVNRFNDGSHITGERYGFRSGIQMQNGRLTLEGSKVSGKLQGSSKKVQRSLGSLRAGLDIPLANGAYVGAYVVSDDFSKTVDKFDVLESSESKRAITGGVNVGGNFDETAFFKN